MSEAVNMGLDYRQTMARSGPNWVVVGEGRRRGLIPSFYVPHTDPEHTIVKQGGVPLLSPNGRPFRVSEMPVERRWAVTNSGELLTFEAFRTRWEQKYYEEFEALGADNPDTRPSPGKPENRGIPNIRDYVSVQPSPEDPWRLEPMHYVAHPTGDRPKPQVLYDPTGENPKPRAEALAAAYADPKARSAMKQEEIDEVEQGRGPETRRRLSLTEKLDRLNQQLVNGEIGHRAHANAVARLVGKAPAKKKARRKKAPQES